MKRVLFISFLITNAGVLLLTSTVDVAITSRRLTPFTAVKSVNNDYLCAFFPGLKSTVMTTTPQICCLECYRDSSCGGFNLRDNDTTCELYTGIQPLLTMTRGCRHFARGLGVAPLTMHQISTGRNAALNGNAIQIGTYTDGVASNAVDGSVLTRSCSSTVVQPWWSVDLASPQQVIAVQVTNDGNAYYSYRLDNFFVWVSNVQPTVGQALNTTQCTLCRQYSGSVPAHGIVFVKCSVSPPAYRYIIIQSSITQALCLAEVEVYVGLTQV